jgi:hypothetical protein
VRQTSSLNKKLQVETEKKALQREAFFIDSQIEGPSAIKILDFKAGKAYMDILTAETAKIDFSRFYRDSQRAPRALR